MNRFGELGNTIVSEPDGHTQKEQRQEKLRMVQKKSKKEILINRTYVKKDVNKTQEIQQRKKVTTGDISYLGDAGVVPHF